MTRIVITGGAGFVGSNLARYLTKVGLDVVAIDDLSFGRAGNLPPDLRLVVGDVARGHVWNEMDSLSAVVHLAGASSAPMFSEDLVGSFQKNISGILQVLEAAHRVGCRRVIYASTSVVYGNCPGPLCEDGSVDVINMYAASKWCMERIGQVYQRLHREMDIVGLRFMSVYGPREDHKGTYANLVSQFIWDLEADRRPVIYGDGSQTRDFVCVWDVAEAIRLAIAYPDRLGNTIFNVGTGVPTSLNDLVACLGEITGTHVRPHYVENPYGALYNKHQDAKIEAVESTLGFKAKVTLREGIKEILDWRGWQEGRDGTRSPPGGTKTPPSAADGTDAIPHAEGAPRDD